MIDFNQIRPEILCYECVNLSGNDYCEALSLITKYGYKWTQDEYNIIAQYESE